MSKNKKTFQVGLKVSKKTAKALRRFASEQETICPIPIAVAARVLLEIELRKRGFIK